MRSIYKEWKNISSYKVANKGRYGWTRRVKWYHDAVSVRLKFEDIGKGLVANKLYNLLEQKELADQDYDRFKNGEPVEVWLDGQRFMI